MRAHIHIRIRMRMRIYICIYIHVYLHTYLHTYTGEKRPTDHATYYSYLNLLSITTAELKKRDLFLYPTFTYRIVEQEQQVSVRSRFVGPFFYTTI